MKKIIYIVDRVLEAVISSVGILIVFIILLSALIMGIVLFFELFLQQNVVY